MEQMESEWSGVHESSHSQPWVPNYQPTSQRRIAWTELRLHLQFFLH